MAKRKALIVAVSVAHFLAAIILLARTGAVMSVIQSPALSPESVRMIWIQTAILSVPALLLLVGVVGLWLARPWGWMAAALADAILVGLVIGDWLLGGQRVDHVPVLAILVVLLLPFLVPHVRALLTSTPD
ncbi:hypothetical protein [Natronospira bacteriovora]|uniref:Uncharacterized protein n=1 Tax=Natronospira bacteriovora TaxID=3069753 RepID=A0ABU0W8H0_9GAMM|nr:hypothetical protein [Natronospira sp. AB-CW4]MDQ2070323.1 hypothetical protein [Natronospira sp. AB-CW4]